MSRIRSSSHSSSASMKQTTCDRAEGLDGEPKEILERLDTSLHLAISRPHSQTELVEYGIEPGYAFQELQQEGSIHSGGGFLQLAATRVEKNEMITQSFIDLRA
ncbi:hypothetical protein DL766_006265 [Monosporascus sp. MC13-8B]|uniref:Uncharacterized protein n=1 Tax=Monosporascus cannonballus TaxID=155416 RepID=A0ABY0H9J0_9PEZI|nr:hypothetical protein DL762_003860 [Monosporascus cannonballus]RYO92853.1 hypothetical protein DL763_004578 [Monosporascus cannonballus]RYP27670.1 hypothetical protein DL766_006265 [Monosporascus sp. MC13-8B]